MNRYERVHSWKERVKGLPKEPGQKLFEFYRVLSATGYEELSISGFERCHPYHWYIEATPESLTERCTTAYGSGAFIALEVGESLDGLPITYWAIRVLSADRWVVNQLFPDTEQLERLRKHDVLLPNYGCKDEAWFIQRGNEACAIAMEFLPKLRVPEKQEIKPLVIWKKLLENPPQGQPGESLFVFFRVDDGWMIDPTPRIHFKFELCEPLLQRATPKTLAKVCSRAYGGGSFVAVEVNESLDGHALSYWKMRIKSRDQYRLERAFIDDERLKAMRQSYPLVRDEEGMKVGLDQGQPFDRGPDRKEAYAWQWGVEASMVAHELQSLSIPEKKKRKASRKPPGRPTDPALNYVREQKAQGKSPKDIVQGLVARKLVNENDIDGAYNKIKNAPRKDQIKHQKKSAKK